VAHNHSIGDIMSRTFEGKVSLVKNTNGEIALKRDVDGKWDATMAVALYERMQELSETMNAPLHKWSLFVVDGGVDAVLMADRYGNPRLTLLPPKAQGSKTSKIEVLD
jgi:hypothetical protein